MCVTADVIWIARDGHHLELCTKYFSTEGEIDLLDSLQAPMPGTVLLVHVRDGDAVSRGDVLIVLESMKMELAVTAPHDGTVDGLTLQVGDRIARGQALLAVHAAAVHAADAVHANDAIDADDAIDAIDAIDGEEGE